MTIGDFLLRRLEEAGVRHLFGVPGDYNLELLQQLQEDCKKYASTGGWGFAQFNDRQPADEAVHKTCFGCHACQRSRLRLHPFLALIRQEVLQTSPAGQEHR
jgi:hypothetical protein